jgi:hypothetical protein
MAGKKVNPELRENRKRDKLATQIALQKLDENRLYPIPLALLYLDKGRRKFYEDVRAGRIRIVKDGRRSFCSGAEIIRRSRVSA